MKRSPQPKWDLYVSDGEVQILSDRKRVELERVARQHGCTVQQAAIEDHNRTLMSMLIL